jgi:hypothetical protein
VASANTDISVSESGGVYTLTFNPANVTLDEFTGPLAITKGGTGAATATAGFNALSPTTTAGDISYHNGTDDVRLAKGTAYQGLRMNSAATAPEWSNGAPDSTTVVFGSADATKQLRFEVDGFTTATTRVLTPPNADATIAGLGVAQAFSAQNTFNWGMAGARSRGLASATPIAFVEIGIPNNGAYGGFVDYAISAANATDVQCLAGTVPWAAVNDAGTEYAAVGTSAGTVAVSSGTLTATFAVTTGLTDVIRISTTATSSLATLTAFVISFNVRVITSSSVTVTTI